MSMAGPRPSKVVLLQGSSSHADGLRYEVDGDLLTLADVWSVTLSISPERVTPAAARSGEPAGLRLDDDPPMVGRLDTVSQHTFKGKVRLTIDGSDNSGQLLSKLLAFE